MISGEMIAIDHQPYNHVENYGFKRLINHAWPNYKIPSRNYFSETVIPTIYNDVRHEVAGKLKDCDSLAMTSDEWTSLCSKFGVVSLTASYITDNFERRSFTVCSEKITGSATASNVAASIDKVLTSWDDDTGIRSKLTTVTTDEGKFVCVLLFCFLFVWGIPRNRHATIFRGEAMYCA